MTRPFLKVVTLGENCFVRDCDVFIVTFRDGTLEPIYDVFDAKKWNTGFLYCTTSKFKLFKTNKTFILLKYFEVDKAWFVCYDKRSNDHQSK